MPSTQTKTCAKCAHAINRKYQRLHCAHPDVLGPLNGTSITVVECQSARSEGAECGPKGIHWQIKHSDHDIDEAIKWLFSSDWPAANLIFSDSGGVQPGRASGQVGEHLAGHRIDPLVTGPGFEQRSKVAEIRLAGAGERQHEVAQHLLGDVQRFEVVFVEHGKPPLKMFIEGAEAVAAVAKAMLSE